MKELRKIVGDITVCIVGNKIDLEKNRNVSQQDAEQYVISTCLLLCVYTYTHTQCCVDCRYAASVKAKHYQTSAKLHKGIQELFLDLAKSKYIE